MTLSLIALAATSMQPAAAGPPAGVWEGTVGTLSVRACFLGPDEGAFGAYYYRARLQLIALAPVEGARGAFREATGRGDGAGPEADAPRWQIERAAGGTLTARWTSGRRTLPVRLRRIAGAVDEGPCASLFFHAPRLAGLRTVRARGSTDGVAWTRLRLDHGGRFGVSVESFALDGTGAAVRRLNATFGRSLTSNPPEWLDCIRGTLVNGPYEGDYRSSLAPVMIARRWLSVADSNSGFCGGARPFENSSFRTFDLASGLEVDLHDWLNRAAVERERVEGGTDILKRMQPAFRSFLLTGWRGDGECDEIVRGTEFWTIGLTRDGLVFTPSLPHAVRLCHQDFMIGFDRLRPFLTPDALAQIAALRAERP